MRVKDFMSTDVVTVDEDTSIHDARKIMETKKIRRLPVMDGSRLVGLVTERMLLEASPSQATTLSIHELQYILAKMTVRDIMVRDPLTITSDMPAEEAMQLGQEKGYGAFPVVDTGRLVGIVTESDIVRIMTQILGTKGSGCRVDILTNREFGNLQKIMKIFDDKKIPLLSLMVMNDPKGAKGESHIFVRLKCETGDDIVNDLRSAGFNVTDFG